MQMPAYLKRCEEVRTFLMDYLDNELPIFDAVLFRLHVLLCSACRKYLNRYTDSVTLAKNILDDPPPPELVNLSTEFLQKHAQRRQRNKRQSAAL